MALKVHNLLCRQAIGIQILHYIDQAYRNKDDANFGLLPYSQGKLCYVECAQLDVQVRPVFAGSVTYKACHNLLNFGLSIIKQLN